GGVKRPLALPIRNLSRCFLRNCGTQVCMFSAHARQTPGNRVFLVVCLPHYLGNTLGSGGLCLWLLMSLEARSLFRDSMRESYQRSRRKCRPKTRRNPGPRAGRTGVPGDVTNTTVVSQALEKRIKDVYEGIKKGRRNCGECARHALGRCTRGRYCRRVERQR